MEGGSGTCEREGERGTASRGACKGGTETWRACVWDDRGDVMKMTTSKLPASLREVVRWCRLRRGRGKEVGFCACRGFVSYLCLGRCRQCGGCWGGR